MCDPVTAILGGGAALGFVGDIIGGDKAASAQTDAANASANIQRQIYQQTRTDLEPWRAGGQIAQQGAINLLGLGPAPSGPDIPGGTFGFKTTPGYQFRFDEGIRAIDASAASRGNLLSGATMKSAQRYGDGLGAQEFDAYYNRLIDMSNRGQNSAAAVGSAGANYASGASNALLAGGAASANQALGASNSFNNLLGNAAGIYGNFNARQSGFPTSWRP